MSKSMPSHPILGIRRRTPRYSRLIVPALALLVGISLQLAPGEPSEEVVAAGDWGAGGRALYLPAVGAGDARPKRTPTPTATPPGARYSDGFDAGGPAPGLQWAFAGTGSA